MNDLGWIGVWLLVFSTAVIVLEGGLAGIWTARLARRARRLSVKLAAEQDLVQADMERLRAALTEMRTLWQPYEQAMRYLRHPLLIALFQSLLRRRAGAK